MTMLSDDLKVNIIMNQADKGIKLMEKQNHYEGFMNNTDITSIISYTYHL